MFIQIHVRLAPMLVILEFKFILQQRVALLLMAFPQQLATLIPLVFPQPQPILTLQVFHQHSQDPLQLEALRPLVPPQQEAIIQYSIALLEWQFLTFKDPMSALFLRLTQIQLTDFL